MKRILLLAVFPVVLALTVPARTATPDENLEEAIDYLVEFVRTSDVVFIRNDKEHNPEEAASHMLKKYKYAKRKVKTPEDFIKYCATKSTMSGKPYRVRLEDGRTITSEEWLLAALEDYRRADGGEGFVFEMREFRKQYGTCPAPQEDCASVVVRYPEISGADANSAMGAIARDIMARLVAPVYEDTEPGTLAELADTFIGAYKNMQTDFPDYRLGWMLEREASVEFTCDSLVSIAYTEMSFAGGAHPNSRKRFANYRMSDGSLIDLKDILVEGYRKQLTRAAEMAFRADRQLDEDDSLEEAGFWFEGGEFDLNDNFGIAAGGLVFHFGYYEIAPYAMGPTEIVVPYDKISSLIRTDGLLKGVVR